MLVVQRNQNESLTLRWPNGASARVIVCRDGFNKTKIGIDAPDEVQVVRGELDDGVYRLPSHHAELAATRLQSVTDSAVLNSLPPESQ